MRPILAALSLLALGAMLLATISVAFALPRLHSEPEDLYLSLIWLLISGCVAVFLLASFRATRKVSERPGKVWLVAHVVVALVGVSMLAAAWYDPVDRVFFTSVGALTLFGATASGAALLHRSRAG